MSGIIIGLKGERGVGKSKFSDLLQKEYGFSRIHPFDGGKVASRAYFMHLGADEDTARRMTDGDLKDKPSKLLPIIKNPDHGRVGDHYDPRFFMEKLGRCMGVDMGTDFTLGAELERQQFSSSESRIVCESIVYEKDYFKEAGGTIIDVVAPGRANKIKGVETDAFGRGFDGDITFVNEFDGLDRYYAKIRNFLLDEFGLEPVAGTEDDAAFEPG